MKKLLSLILVTLMMVSMVPSVMAAEVTATTNLLGYTYPYAATSTTASDFTEMPVFTAYGNGVTSGTTEYGTEGDAIPYAAGSTLGNQLTDGYYFTYGETAWAATLGTNEEVAEGVDTTKMAPAESTKKMIKLAEGNGFDINWTEAQTVARLHIWAWPANVINGYEIYVKDASGNWGAEPAMTDSLKDFEPTAEPSATNSTFYAIILPQEYSTTGVRFVVTDLVENHNEVYITEAVPRSTNAIDLADMNPRSTIDTTTVATNKVEPSLYVNRSTAGYINSEIQTNEVTNRMGSWGFASVTPAFGKMMTYGGSNAYKWMVQTIEVTENETTTYNNRDPFYAVDFGENKQRINRIKSYIHSSKSGVKAVQLWCSDSEASYTALATEGGEYHEGWTLVGERTSLTTSSQTSDFLNAPEARFWKLVYVIEDGATSYGRIVRTAGMYSMREDELAGYVPPAEPTAEPTATPTSTPTPTPTPEPTPTPVPVVSATPAPGKAGAIGAVTTGDRREGTVVEAVHYADGAALPELEDDYHLNWPEWRTLAAATNYTKSRPFSNTADFIKFTEANSGVYWNYDAPKTVKRLDLWVYPLRSIDTCKVEWYDEATSSWKSQTADFNLMDGAPGEMANDTGNSTNWYSIVLEEEVSTSKLRFVITGLTARTDDIAPVTYLAEANVEETNDTNLTSPLAEDNLGKAYSMYAYDSIGTTSTGTTKLAGNDSFRGWGSNSYIMRRTTTGNMWYTVSFGDTSPHKINRIGFEVDSGTVTEFEIWYSNTKSDFENGNLAGSQEANTWQKLATVKGEYSASNKARVDIPGAPSACYWMIRITESTSGARLYAPAYFYELAEYELNKTWNGTVAAGEVLTLNLDNYDAGLAAKTDDAADVYFALYDGDTLLDVAKAESVALDGYKNYALYKIPASATGTLKVKAFIWDNELKPMTIVPAVKQ
ncbi:MAG: hypothetical protein II997_05300 [Clostridia bacterium]|nr:hypothetical protein [Clostridia bacterium]